MSLRPATIADIPELMRVRFLVHENVLSNPALVTLEDYQLHLSTDGFGFVWEENGQILGFSIMNTRIGNVWALFVDAAHDRRGIGRALHDALMDRYFAENDGQVWLSTEPGTRAEGFYRKAGWVAEPELWKGEVKFWMGKAAYERMASGHSAI